MMLPYFLKLPADNMTRPADPAPPQSVSDQASAWFARMQSGQVSPEETAAFELWYHADAGHAEAYEKTRQLWSLLALPAENVHHRLKAELPAVTTSPRRSPSSRLKTGLAGFTSLILLLTLCWQAPKLLQNWQSDYLTGPGELRQIELADGSRVTLNTDTALAVNYGGQQRVIELLRGEAFFEVAPDKARPFTVNSGNVAARAVGTAYSVYKQTDGTRVMVEHGIVEVSESTQTQLAVQVLANQQISVAGSRLQAVGPADETMDLAWRRGQIVFIKQPLAAVIEQVNRYRHGGIIIMNPALKPRIVSGVFDSRDPDGVVAALSATLRVKAVNLPGQWALLY